MKARWHGRPYFDIGKGLWLITLETEEEPTAFDKTRDVVLSVEIKKHAEKRSLSANAYFHLLVDKIAKVMKISDTEAKNMMLARYGYIDEDVPEIILRESINWQKLDNLHLRPTTHSRTMDNNRMYRVYLVVRGSHTYDTKEMASLIDGTVEEAKELGIETMPPDELERMVNAWKAL